MIYPIHSEIFCLLITENARGFFFVKYKPFIKKERNLIYVQKTDLDKRFQLNHDFKNQFMLSIHPIVFYLFDSSGHLTLTPILIIFVYHTCHCHNPRILYIIILKWINKINSQVYSISFYMYLSYNCELLINTL